MNATLPCDVTQCFIFMSLSTWLRLPFPPPSKNFLSTDLRELENRPLGKLGWTLPPQSTPWRRHCLCQVLHSVNSAYDVSYVLLAPFPCFCICANFRNQILENWGVRVPLFPSWPCHCIALDVQWKIWNYQGTFGFSLWWFDVYE